MQVLKYFKHHKVIMGALVAVMVLATAIYSHVASRNNKDAGTETALAKVTLISVNDYRRDLREVQANGTVESLQQAELRSAVLAPVSKINVAIGSQVKAGQVLVVLQNSDIAAQLAQAQAGLKAQQARMEEMQKGMRAEEAKVAQAQLDSAKQTFEDTKKQQDILVANAYTSLLNSGLSATAGAGNTGPSQAVVSGTYTGQDQGQYQISIYATGGGLRFKASGLESADGSVDTVPQPIGKKGLFIQFSDKNVPTNNTWTIDIPNTRSPGYLTAKSMYDTALQGRQAAVDGASNALTAAQTSFDLKQAGASEQQLKAQQAAVEQAQASVAGISAQLDKTYIRTPIDGTISAIPVKYGELLTMGQSVVSIVNKNGMQVKAYVSGNDLSLLSEGAQVVIGQQASGTVSQISPSIDPRSKNAEVNVLVLNPGQSGLTVGQTVDVKIMARQQAASGPAFLLPLQAVKQTADTASVYIVNNNSVLEDKKVTLGRVVGEFVEVTDGLKPDMKIVSPVYELKAGEKVATE